MGLARGCLLGETGVAVTLLPSLLAQPGVSAVKLVSLLGTSLIGVGIARTRYDQGLRSRALNDAVFQSMLKIRPPGLPPYKEEAARWARWASEWPMARVRSALRAARATDEALKNTTLSDDRGLVADLVLRMTIASSGGSVSTRPPVRLLRIGAALVTASLSTPRLHRLKPTRAYSRSSVRPRRAGETRPGSRSSICSLPLLIPIHFTRRSCTPRRWSRAMRRRCGVSSSAWPWSSPLPVGPTMRSCGWCSSTLPAGAWPVRLGIWKRSGRTIPTARYCRRQRIGRHAPTSIRRIRRWLAAGWPTD